jgi:hypothetical protein
MTKEKTMAKEKMRRRKTRCKSDILSQFEKARPFFIE